MITSKVDEAEVDGMKLCDLPLTDDEKENVFGDDCKNRDEEDGGCEDDDVEEETEVPDERFMDETVIKFLVFVFSDMSAKGLVELYKATKSFVQDRDRIKGAALSKIAALEVIKLIEDVKISIYMKEDEMI